MREFTLDTSGTVLIWVPYIPGISGPQFHPIRWSDLSPFEQGCVEAMLSEVELVAKWLDNVDPYRAPGFSDLARETLAAIRKDCAAFLAGNRSWLPTRDAGREFWRRRQEIVGYPYPPLTVSLGDDGKVYARATT